MKDLKVSEILINARKHAGVSLEIASEETKISLKHLEALERDDYDAFPNHALALGFLRTYLRFLELDEDAVSVIFQKNVEEGLAYKRNPLSKISNNSPIRKDPLRMRGNGSFSASSNFSSDFYRSFLIGVGAFFLIIFLGFLIFWSYSYFSREWVPKEVFINWDGINSWEGSVQKGLFLILEENDKKSEEIIILESGSNIVLRLKDQEINIPSGGNYLVDLRNGSKEDLLLSYNNSTLSLKPIPEAEFLVTFKTIQDRNKLFPQVPFAFTPISSEDWDKEGFLTALERPIYTPLRLEVREESFIRYMVDDSKVEESLFVKGDEIDLSFVNSVLIWVTNPKAVDVISGDKNFDLFEDSIFGIGQLIWTENSQATFELRFLPL